MIRNSSPSKQQLSQLVDHLSDAQAHAVLAFAQFLTLDPVSRAIVAAPPDDEPVTPEEEVELERARQEPRVRIEIELDDLLNL